MARIKDGETIILQRKREDRYGTHGVLIYGGRYICFTLELPWADNKRQVSCIPKGKYKCVAHNGPKYKGVWRLEAVPDRDDVLIHWGNWMKNTRGCILVGLQAIKEGVAQSLAAIDMLRDTLPEEHFFLDVRNPDVKGL